MMSKYAIRATSVGIRCLSNYTVAQSSKNRTNVSVFDKKLIFLSKAGAGALMIQETHPQIRQMSGSIIDEINKAKKAEQEEKKKAGMCIFTRRPNSFAIKNSNSLLLFFCHNLH